MPPVTDACAMRDEATAWWKQSQADLKTARDSLVHTNFYAAAFFSQQSAEKALKCLLLSEERESYIGHGLVFLARRLRAPDEIARACAELTPHLTARYPDAALGTPAENYTREAAERFVQLGEEVVSWVASRLKP